MKIIDAINYFQDFMQILMSNELTNCSTICICIQIKIEQPSKGNKEKVQLILVMSREADLYVLDEPIGGADPAARDYILQDHYSKQTSKLFCLWISTHFDCGY